MRNNKVYLIENYIQEKTVQDEDSINNDLRKSDLI